MGFDVRPVEMEGGVVKMIDQRRLPHEEVWVELHSAAEVARSIRDMVVRGAPAIGVSAAMGLAIEAQRLWRQGVSGPREFLVELRRAGKVLSDARPTAVNLSWAVERMLGKAGQAIDRGIEGCVQALLSEAQAIRDEDIAMNRAMGRYGADLIRDGWTVMTHCNAGALATAGYGTALGVLRAAREQGKQVKVVACETRPYLQGARLTAWELQRDGFDVTLIADSAAGYLMSKGEIQLVVVGADHIAGNGDVANKIGTYTHAVLARRHEIPFVVVAPSSTVSMNTPDGSHIVVEERPQEEVLEFRGQRVAPEGVGALNPAFDVTPWTLVTAIVTEKGVHRPGPEGYDFARDIGG